MKKAGRSADTVSYTHLDVYKRQVLLHLFQPCQKLLFQGLGHVQDAVGLFGLSPLKDQRGLAPLPSVREGVVDLGGVDLGQGDLVGTLQGFVHRDGSPSVCCIKVQITRL